MSYQRGTSFNLSLRGAAELSESVTPLDDLIPELPSRLAAPDDMRTPAYIAPYITVAVGKKGVPLQDHARRDIASVQAVMSSSRINSNDFSVWTSFFLSDEFLLITLRSLDETILDEIRLNSSGGPSGVEIGLSVNPHLFHVSLGLGVTESRNHVYTIAESLQISISKGGTR